MDGMYCFGTTVYTCLIFAMNWKVPYADALVVRHLGVKGAVES